MIICTKHLWAQKCCSAPLILGEGPPHTAVPRAPKILKTGMRSTIYAIALFDGKIYKRTFVALDLTVSEIKVKITKYYFRSIRWQMSQSKAIPIHFYRLQRNQLLKFLPSKSRSRSQ